MVENKIKEELKRILKKIGSDIEITNKKISPKHIDETELLLQHLAMSVEYLLMDAQASRNELFDLKRLNEYGDTDDGDNRILGL
jgi:hypothetical protein